MLSTTQIKILFLGSVTIVSFLVIWIIGIISWGFWYNTSAFMYGFIVAEIVMSAIFSEGRIRWPFGFGDPRVYRSSVVGYIFFVLAVIAAGSVSTYVINGFTKGLEDSGEQFRIAYNLVSLVFFPASGLYFYLRYHGRTAKWFKQTQSPYQ